MSLLFISYSSKDKIFATRLAKDLRAAGADIWLDENELFTGQSVKDTLEKGLSACDRLLVLISEHSLGSEWVDHELLTACERERDNTGCEVLPVRLQNINLPSVIAHKKSADFFQSYESGLDQLLNAIRPAHCKPMTSPSDRSDYVARRGIRTNATTRHRIAVMSLGTERWWFATVIESVGLASLAPAMTALIGKNVATMVQKDQTLSSDSIVNYVKLADALAGYFRVENNLSEYDALSAKMVIMLRIDDAVFVGTAGDCCAFVRRSIEGGYQFNRYQSTMETKVKYILGDPKHGFISAPLGLIMEDTPIKMKIERFDLQSEEDYVALLSFGLAKYDSSFGALGQKLSTTEDLEVHAKTLAEIHEPATVDSVCWLSAKATRK